MSKVMLAKLLSQKKWSLGPFLYWIKICAISFSFWPCHLPQRVNMSKLPFLRPSGLASYEISKSVRGSITHFCYFWVVYHGNVITNEYCHQKHQNVQYTCLMAEERLRLSWRFLRWVVGIGGHGFFSRGEVYFVSFFTKMRFSFRNPFEGKNAKCFWKGGESNFFFIQGVGG